MLNCDAIFFLENATQCCKNAEKRIKNAFYQKYDTKNCNLINY